MENTTTKKRKGRKTAAGERISYLFFSVFTSEIAENVIFLVEFCLIYGKLKWMDEFIGERDARVWKNDRWLSLYPSFFLYNLLFLFLFFSGPWCCFCGLCIIKPEDSFVLISCFPFSRETRVIIWINFVFTICICLWFVSVGLV